MYGIRRPIEDNDETQASFVMRVVKSMQKCLVYGQFWIKWFLLIFGTLGLTVWPAMEITHWVLKEDPLTLKDLWASHSFEFCVVNLITIYLKGVA